ncbi:hypothetical protein ACOME3_003688 [Neoechinorhynchus agilis]
MATFKGSSQLSFAPHQLSIDASTEPELERKSPDWVKRESYFRIAQVCLNAIACLSLIGGFARADFVRDQISPGLEISIGIFRKCSSSYNEKNHLCHFSSTKEPYNINTIPSFAIWIIAEIALNAYWISTTFTKVRSSIGQKISNGVDIVLPLFTGLLAFGTFSDSVVQLNEHCGCGIFGAGFHVTFAGLVISMISTSSMIFVGLDVKFLFF